MTKIFNVFIYKQIQFTLLSIEYRGYDAIERYAFQYILDDIIDPVIAQLLPDNVKLFKKFLEHLTFTGIACHHIEYDDIRLLPVSVNAPHTLLQTIGIPRYIPVNQ